MRYDPETKKYHLKWYASEPELELIRWRQEMALRDKFENQENFTWLGADIEVIPSLPVPWKLYGVTKDDEKTWLGDFESEKEITGIANFFANNPHFEHMEIYEGEVFRYAVMRIVGR